MAHQKMCLAYSKHAVLPSTWWNLPSRDALLLPQLRHACLFLTTPRTQNRKRQKPQGCSSPTANISAAENSIELSASGVWLMNTSFIEISATSCSSIRLTRNSGRNISLNVMLAWISRDVVKLIMAWRKNLCPSRGIPCQLLGAAAVENRYLVFLGFKAATVTYPNLHM